MREKKTSSEISVSSVLQAELKAKVAALFESGKPPTELTKEDVEPVWELVVKAACEIRNIPYDLLIEGKSQIYWDHTTLVIGEEQVNRLLQLDARRKYQGNDLKIAKFNEALAKSSKAFVKKIPSSTGREDDDTHWMGFNEIDPQTLVHELLHLAEEVFVLRYDQPYPKISVETIAIDNKSKFFLNYAFVATSFSIVLSLFSELSKNKVAESFIPVTFVPIFLGFLSHLYNSYKFEALQKRYLGHPRERFANSLNHLFTGNKKR